MSKKIMVSICCITYNQEKYIAKALDSFLNQKTDFSYEIVIHDDASTDGTVDIIKEYKNKYPDKIVTIFEKENQYSKRHNSVLDIVFSKASGKYIALCEGDDGFCNKNKLQLQFDKLESDNSISLVSHNTIIVDGDGILLDDNIPYSEGIVKEVDFLNNYSSSMHTSSLMFRKKDVESLPDYFKKSLVGDLPLKLYLLSIGNCYHINKLMSFYRVNSFGSWTSKQKDNKKQLNDNFINEIKTYNLFNEASDYKYDIQIKNRILNRKFKFYKDDGNLEEIKKKEYSELYANLSFNEKVKLYLKNNKIVYGAYRMVKYGKRG